MLSTQEAKSAEENNLQLLTQRVTEGDRLATEDENYEDAIDRFTAAVRISKQIHKDFYYTAEIYRRIGFYYSELAAQKDRTKNTDLSINYYRKALNHSATYAPSLDDAKKRQIVLDKVNDAFTLAEIYRTKGKLDRMFEYIEKGFALHQTLTHPVYPRIKESKEESRALDILIECVNDLRNVKSNMKYYEKALAIFRKLNTKYPADSLAREIDNIEHNFQQLSDLADEDESVVPALKKPERTSRQSSFAAEDKSDSERRSEHSILKVLQTGSLLVKFGLTGASTPSTSPAPSPRSDARAESVSPLPSPRSEEISPATRIKGLSLSGSD
ncbi:MAG TPA: hypothetical protein VLJ15_05510 [Gammaproteobacteria bacterium]|nr:hypothetical protein [Gammaproteobacteria bacterium]